MRVVCIGDSLTFGFGVNELHSWVSLLRKNIRGEVINSGINGDTTDGMQYRFESDVISYKPTHVIIMGGSNDFIMGRKIEDVSTNIESMLKTAVNNKVIPIVAVQPPTDPEMANKCWSSYTDFYEVNKNIRIYRDWIINNKQTKNIDYMDFYNIIQHSLNVYNKEEIYVDGVHLTPRGHCIMAGTINL